MNKIRVIITGTTGMVGKGVLFECLDHPQVSQVLVINRQSIGVAHPKLSEIIHSDFFNLSAIATRLVDYDACFFCLGTTSFRMKEENYKKITYDLTIHVAETLLKQNRNMIFCYVSGQGTDSTEKGRMMWARVKGKTENALLNMGFRRTYMFRPGYIHPTRGIRSRTKAYNMVYVVTKPMYPLIRMLFGNAITTTDLVGRAMINAVLHGYDKNVLQPVDINRLGSEQRSP